MSITILSTLPASASGTANLSALAPEEAEAGGFADLLLGCLLSEETLPGLNVDNDPRKNRSDETSSTLLPDLGEDPLAQMEAAMALVPAMLPLPSPPVPNAPEEILLDDADAAKAFLAATPEALSPETSRAADPAASGLFGENVRQTTEPPAFALPELPELPEEAALENTHPVAQNIAQNAVEEVRTLLSSAKMPESAGREAAKIASPASTTLNMNAAPPLSAVSAPAVAESAPLAVSTPLGKPDWSTDFGQKIIWLAKNDRQSAQITLSPPHTGPIEVSLNINKNTASAVFVSASPEVRESIESALPRLREMFASAGIELGQAHVSAESFSQQRHNLDQETSRWRSDNVILPESPVGMPQPRSGIMSSGRGFVDIFA